MGRGNYRGRIQKSEHQQNGHHNRHQGLNQQALVSDSQYNTASPRGGRGQGRVQGRGRGGINERGRGLQIRGRGRGYFNPDFLLNHVQQQDRNELVKIIVEGLLESDVADEKDNGLATCRDWLEDRARNGSRRPIDDNDLWSALVASQVPRPPTEIQRLSSPMRSSAIGEPRWEGDDMAFEVKKSDAWRVLKSDGQIFHNVVLSVKRADQEYQEIRSSTRSSTTAATDPVERMEQFRQILIDRYDAENKLLKLDRLGSDIRLRDIGTWDPTATRRKHTDFFQGLMRFCESETAFQSRAIKAEQVEGVSLAHNDLTNLAPVLEVVRAFPDIRNLDLSNNKFKDLRALELFRWRFKRLDRLDISQNPVEFEDPEYEHTITSWFPSLRTLNARKVRSDEAAASAVPNDGLPLTTVKDNFQDEAGIAESAIKQLIMGTDNDRPAFARSFYDNESTFSVSFNPSAPRIDTAQTTSWEPHVKQSRNLKKVFQLEPRIRRMAKGIYEIESALKILPPTRHPDLINDAPRYSFDCTPIPGVPDPHNRIESGVGGFKVDIRGSFDELDRNTGVKNATRSFDRVFILGPGDGENQLRIVSDILTLRADGGYEAFNPEAKAMPDLPMITKNFGFPEDMEIGRAAMATEFSKATKLAEEHATTLLRESGWDFILACKNFETARANGMLLNGYFKPELHEPATSNPAGIYY
ncbi:MAG: hypothetical protein Q9196_000219 [Gyalolechia fulgens]